MIENSETTLFGKVDKSITKHAKKLVSSHQESPISLKMKEALTKKKDELSLDKSASTANKLLTPIKKSATSTSITAKEKNLCR